jgi:hypothetical protein
MDTNNTKRFFNRSARVENPGRVFVNFFGRRVHGVAKIK